MKNPETPFPVTANILEKNYFVISMEAIFWQYPVITEKIFYDQNSSNKNYIGIPWATILDKQMSSKALIEMFSPMIDTDQYNITCCQHIHFRKLIKVYKALGIKVVYTPHKVYSENQIDGILLKPCPLYAVNIEDPSKNKELNVNYFEVKRNKLYSFQGAYQKCYLTNVREKLFSLEKKSDIEIRYSGDWHFNKVVYDDSNQNKTGKYTLSERHIFNTSEYNKLLVDSKFSLCPSGSGPNSIRLWESLAVGTIPVLLSDQLELPEHPLWQRAIVRILEKDVANLDYILRSISENEIVERRKNCIEIYKYFRKNFINSEYDSSRKRQNIIHYCCGNYQTGDFGGVARFDHCLKCNFPNVIMYQGPHQKKEFLSFIKQCERPPIIFTDNHLACDIPNEFFTIVVNHGCARRTNANLEDWDSYWKDLCMNGQTNMLEHRKVETTIMMPICTSVREDFRRYHGPEYDKYKNDTILHYSFFDEKKVKKYKTETNLKTRILGKFNGKTSEVIDDIINSELSDKYYFQNLNSDGRFFKTVADYIDSLQKTYLQCDMYLQLSNHENSVYEVLDAAVCGIVILSTNIGACSDMPGDCYVRIDYNKAQDISYIENRIEYGLANKQTLTQNARKWVSENHTKRIWKNEISKAISMFVIKKDDSSESDSSDSTDSSDSDSDSDSSSSD